MGPGGVIVTPPDFDEDLGFSQRLEDLPIEELVAPARIEALDVSVLTRRAGHDEGRAGPDRRDPLLDVGNELRAVVRSDGDFRLGPQSQTRYCSPLGRASFQNRVPV